MASAAIRSMQKSNPRKLSIAEATAALEDLEALEGSIKSAITDLSDAISTLSGQPHNSKSGIIASCAELHNSVANCKSVSPKTETSDLDATADILIDLQDLYLFELESLNKKKSTLKTRMSNGFVASVASAKSLEHLNGKDWSRFVPRAVISKDLYNVTLGVVDLEAAKKAPVGSVLRNTAVLVTQCQMQVDAQQKGKEARVAAAKLKTRKERLDVVAKELQEKLNG
ncbi:hypothetical protein N9P17_01925 [Tateyamaria sp.]|nr:hypothetical protein [Tateyamaria sp.]